MRICFVVAMDDNRLIGRGKDLPWHLPADLAHFKKVTMGKPIVMGRRTHESIGRPLPGRQNIVVTRQLDYKAEGCNVVHSIDDAILAAGDAEDVMIIGGAEFYEQTLMRVERIYLTEVHHTFEGDVYFPMLDATQWRELSRVENAADIKNPWSYSFVVMEREDS